MADRGQVSGLLMSWLTEVASSTGLDADLDRRVRAELARWLARSEPAISASERSDITDEALLRAYVAVDEGRLDITRADAPGYVLTIARRIAIDRLRRGQATPLDPAAFGEVARPAPDSDDAAIAAMVDRDADLATVKAAMKRAIEARQFATARVVGTWLDLASVTGEAPSSRDVADKVGLSHTTVRNHLKRFREHLQAVRGEGQP